MTRRPTLLDFLETNPHGWGNTPVAPEVAYKDDAGNSYGFNNQRIQGWADQARPDQSWGDIAYGTATAPARLATGMANALSPYGLDEGWRVPPLAHDIGDVINAPGTILHDGMGRDEFERTGNLTAGFMMGAGPLAAGLDRTLAHEVASAGKARRFEGGIGKYTEQDLEAPWAAIQRAEEEQARNQAIRPELRPLSSPQGYHSNFEEFKPAEWIHNQRVDEIAGRHPEAEGDYWQTWNQAGNTRQNALVSNDRVPIELATDGKTGIAALQGAEKLAGPNGINLDYANLLGQVGPGRSTLHANGSKEGAGVGAALAEGQQPIRGYTGTPDAWAGPFDPARARATNGAGAAILEGEKPAGITAYHGSPHDFDKFSTDHIGNGEGAQAYGHGLYFAENEGVAKSYKNTLSDRTIGGQPLDYSNPAHVAADYVSIYGDDALNVIKADALKRTGGGTDELRRAVAFVENGTAPKVDGGHMYQVKINANPDDFLDWDKPLSQQSEKVQRVVPSLAAKALGQLPEHYRSYTPNSDRLREMINGKFADYRFDDIYWDKIGPEVSQALGDVGIPGIRYLDQMSRDAGAGTHNYVTFDDSLIDILRKYGVAGALGAKAAINWDDPEIY